MTSRPGITLAILGVLAGAAGLAGCGEDGSDAVALSPLATEGRDLFRDRGCAACHGRNGEGGTGPQLEGLYGSEVALDDGTSVLADDAYLHESIADPGAKQVDGYGVKMPTNDLDDEQIASVIAYLRELGGGSGADAGADEADLDLSELASEGRDIANSNGCGACHGVNGEGGLAAPFVGLIGSEIELDDGTTVIVDEAYVREAITDPGARKNAAFTLVMPANGLSDDEVDAVIAYITELGGGDAAG